MTKGRVEQLLAAVNGDGTVALLDVQENVAIGLAIWAADAQLHPDRYRASVGELIHALLALHAPQIEALRLKFGLEQEAGKAPDENDNEDEDEYYPGEGS